MTLLSTIVSQPPPPPPKFAVARARLMHRMRAATVGRLTCVVGPAGAGKSLLVRQWSASELARPVAWAIGGLGFADGVSFARELTAALTGAWGEQALFEATRRIETGGERMGTPFLEAVMFGSTGRSPAVLVVEDVHELPPVLIEELVWLVERAPTDIKFVFTSRSEIPGLHRLRTRGELSEIGPLDLALDREESAELVERVSGVRLEPSEVDDLWVRTEGWAVGVQLAAVAVRDRPPGMSTTVAMQRIDRHVGDYLYAEVVDRQPPEVREFLSVTSVLNRLCGPLCDVVTGGNDGEQMLATLEMRTLISPIDSQGSWFRYHPLVAEALRRRLRTTDPDLYEATLRIASGWHLDRDELESAVEYLEDAEAWAEILDLVSLHGWTAYERGEGAAAARWLHAVPPSLLKAHRQASFALAVIERFVGNAATTDALLDDLELRHAPGTRERAGLDILRASGIQWSYPPDKALARADAALAVLDAEIPPEDVLPGQMPDAFLRAVVVLTKGRALVHLGRVHEARDGYLAGLEDQSAYPPWRILMLGGLARAEVAACNLSDASRTANQALEIAAGIGFEDHVSTADASLAAGQVASARGFFEEAQVLLGEAEVRARRNRRSTLVASIVASQVRVFLAQDDTDAASCILSRWKGDNDPLPPEDVLQDLGAVEAMILMREGDLDAAKRVLTGLALTPLTLGVAGQLALASDDPAALRGVLQAWPSDGDVRGKIRHLVWQSITAYHEGRLADAGKLIAAAADMAEPEGFLRIFLDTGPIARKIIASLEVEDPSPFLVEVQARVLPPSEPEPSPNLLSVREMAVLRLLPTALSNIEIANELYISTNTLKTHLRRVYRKLHASSRLTAVESARSLGLL